VSHARGHATWHSTCILHAGMTYHWHAASQHDMPLGMPLTCCVALRCAPFGRLALNTPRDLRKVACNWPVARHSLFHFFEVVCHWHAAGHCGMPLARHWHANCRRVP
jgi:hypothetical protein